MTSVRYVDHILQTTLLSYQMAPPHVFFQQDNTCSHIARQPINFLQEVLMFCRDHLIHRT